ncbi:MAG TPA: FAD-binding protein [Streptosporangiaceae bacterium]|nr:FAD-binding protein [Streptosporangiaceae bacterium]
MAALITGFDPAGRTWVADHAQRSSAIRIPKLKGRLIFDQADRSAAADDFGHIVHHLPQAVLQPGDIEDVAVMLRFCRAHRIPAAPRGQAHATNGQAQVTDGLVIETATLDAIDVGQGEVTVGAGARWSSVLRATLPTGQTPPVLTDYLELSVGGTLSVGGIGGQTQHFGAQVDNVVELEVVTGVGERMVCSPSRHPDLYHAALAGLGQCAVIVRATLPLQPAPVNVRHYILSYSSFDAMAADQRRVLADGRFSFLEGEAQAMPDGSPGWQFFIEAGAYFDGTAPDDQALIGDLAYQRGSEQIDTIGYFDFLDRLAPAVAFLESSGEWFDPHPWWNVFVPSSAADDFVTSVMAGLTEPDIGASGVILIYPLRHAVLRTPLLRIPGEETVFLFSILRTAAPDTGAISADAMISANRKLFDQASRLGGFQYPIGTIPFTQADWRAHYGREWPFFAAARRRYDPRGILTPGQGIFTSDEAERMPL